MLYSVPEESCISEADATLASLEKNIAAIKVGGRGGAITIKKFEKNNGLDFGIF